MKALLQVLQLVLRQAASPLPASGKLVIPMIVHLGQTMSWMLRRTRKIVGKKGTTSSECPCRGLRLKKGATASVCPSIKNDMYGLSMGRGEWERGELQEGRGEGLQEVPAVARVASSCTL